MASDSYPPSGQYPSSGQYPPPGETPNLPSYPPLDTAQPPGSPIPQTYPPQGHNGFQFPPPKKTKTGVIIAVVVIAAVLVAVTVGAAIALSAKRKSDPAASSQPTIAPGADPTKTSSPRSTSPTATEYRLEKSEDRAAQSSLRNAATTEAVYYTDAQWLTNNLGDLDAIEPSLDWTTSGSTGPNSIHVEVCGGKDPANPQHGTAATLSAVSAHGDGFVMNYLIANTGVGGFANGEMSYEVVPNATVPFKYPCTDGTLPGGSDAEIGWTH